ncbi:plasmid maintenance protein [Borreliella garinii]|uniref:plasmid maintenance protein n=2 Tax=Borreliella garinii TaxID=29519 RepID=UPI001AEDA541|nr:plasmid maintenance protein [Borreliella garinii]
MSNLSNNTKSTSCHNKLQHKLIVLISTIKYVNSKYQKYTQKTIFYYFNENLKRNSQATTTLRTMQKYLYKLEKKIKITTNYYKHLGVNCGTEIYYKLNYSKKECYQKINKYFEEKKLSRFQNRVKKHLKEKFAKKGNVNLEKCFNNKNNNIKEERNSNKIEEYKKTKYFNKCNFFEKKTLSKILKLDIKTDLTIEIFKTVKRYENSLAKNKHISFNKSCFKNKQNKLKEILINTQKELEKNGYNSEQLETNIQKIYENYKNKPHFIIENEKYNDLSKIKRKLEKLIEIKKENSQKNYGHIKINIFNILIDQLKKKINIEFLKPILKAYLNSKKKLEYNKVFDNTYYYELLEIIENENNSLKLKKFIKKVM